MEIISSKEARNNLKWDFAGWRHRVGDDLPNVPGENHGLISPLTQTGLDQAMAPSFCTTRA